MHYDEQIDYGLIHNEWEELCSDFKDHFDTKQNRNDLSLEWNTYTCNVYGLSSHSMSNPEWSDALFRYKWDVRLKYSFFDRWKRYRFLQYYDLSYYQNIDLEMCVMEQLRTQLLALIRDLNRNTDKLNHPF